MLGRAIFKFRHQGLMTIGVPAECAQCHRHRILLEMARMGWWRTSGLRNARRRLSTQSDTLIVTGLFYRNA